MLKREIKEKKHKSLINPQKASNDAEKIYNKVIDFLKEMDEKYNNLSKNQAGFDLYFNACKFFSEVIEECKKNNEIKILFINDKNNQIARFHEKLVLIHTKLAQTNRLKKLINLGSEHPVLLVSFLTIFFITGLIHLKDRTSSQPSILKDVAQMTRLVFFQKTIEDIFSTPASFSIFSFFFFNVVGFIFWPREPDLDRIPFSPPPFPEEFSKLDPVASSRAPVYIFAAIMIAGIGYLLAGGNIDSISDVISSFVHEKESVDNLQQKHFSFF